MNILFISHDGDAKGGAGLALLDLIDSFKEYKDIHPVVLIPNKQYGLAEELEKRNIPYILHRYYWWAFIDRKNNIKNIYNYFKLFCLQIKMFLGMPKLIKKINKYNIDLIHTNSSVINIGGMIKCFHKKPHVWHVREFGEEHHNFKFIFGTSKTRKIMEYMSDTIITISEALNTKYLKYISKSKLKRIYDGVSIDKYDNPKSINNKNEEFSILLTGALQKGKGQMEAIEAVNNIILKGIKVNLILVGRCDDINYLKSINNFIKEHNIKDYVKLIGQCDDMNEVRRHADIEIVCSQMEGFGRVTVEGMLSMLPIIASNSGANTELVKDDLNGYIYELGNVDDLEEKILKLYNNKSLVSRMGNRGYKIAKENFTQEINTKNIYDVYCNILK